MGNRVKRMVAAAMVFCLMTFPIPAEAATFVKGGSNGTIEQGGSVWFNSSDKQGDLSGTDSDIQKYLEEAKEKVENENSSIQSNIDEQYKLMDEYAGMKNASNVETNGSASSSSNYLTDDEYRELAQKLGANNSVFNDIVSDADKEVNKEIINTVWEIMNQAGSADEILKDENGNQKTGNQFFPDDYNEKLFRDMLNNQGFNADDFLNKPRQEMIDALEQMMQDYLNRVQQERQDMKERYVSQDPDHRGILSNGDVYEVLKDSFFFQYYNTSFLATCSNCGGIYGYKDGKQYTCSCGKTGYAGAKDHHFDSAGLDDSAPNDQYNRCQYCGKRISAKNIQEFYYQAQASETGGNAGTFACICKDCLNSDGIFVVKDMYTDDNYAQGHGHAFEFTDHISREQLDTYMALDEHDEWYCKIDADGNYTFPNHPVYRDSQVKTGTAEELLGKANPYLSISGSDESLDSMKGMLDFLRNFMEADDDNKKFGDMLDLMLKYDDNGFLNNMPVDPSKWKMDDVENAIGDAAKKMAEDIEKNKKKLIEQNNENDALKKIKDSPTVEGIPGWNERMKLIFGEWPSNYSLWSDDMKDLYKRFMDQYNDSINNQQIIDDMIKNGIFSGDDMQDILDNLDDYMDGYTDIEDKIKVTAVIDTVDASEENVVHAVESLSPTGYTYSINGVAQRSSPWTGGYAAISCHSLGSYSIERICKKIRTEIVTGKATQRITWTAQKGNQTVKLYEKEYTLSYYNSYSKGLAGGEVSMPTIHFNVVAGKQMDLTVNGGFTTERVY